MGVVQVGAGKVDWEQYVKGVVCLTLEFVLDRGVLYTVLQLCG